MLQTMIRLLPGVVAIAATIAILRLAYLLGLAAVRSVDEPGPYRSVSIFYLAAASAMLLLGLGAIWS